MLEASFLTFITTLISFLILLRLGRLSNGFARLTMVILAWVLVQLVARNTALALSPWVEFAGHLLVWSLGLAIIRPDMRGSLLPPMVMVLLVLMVFLPLPALEMLRWGTVTAVPLLAIWSSAQEVEKGGAALGLEEQGAAASSHHEEAAALRPILDKLDQGLFLANSHGEIEYANQSAARLLGIPAADIIGQSIMVVLSRLPMLPTGNGAGSPTRFEMNGRQLEGRIHLLASSEGESLATAAVLTDITDRHQSERGRLAYLTSVSRELRTPLTAIKGYVDLLAGSQTGQLNEEQRAHLSSIERNVSHMVQLINSVIIAASGQEEGPRTRHGYTDLSEVVPRVLAEMEESADRQGLTLTAQLAPDLRPIQVDPLHVTTILQELLANSLQFSEPGGSITVSAALQPGQTADDGFVVIQVTDTGIGIRPQDQRQLFGEFYSAPSGDDVPHDRVGTGVGLAIVHALIEAYNGRLWLKSEIGEGSQFTFVLPVMQHREAVTALPAIS